MSHMVAERRCAQPMQGDLGDEAESLERDLADSKRSLAAEKALQTLLQNKILRRGQEELRDEVPGNAR